MNRDWSDAAAAADSSHETVLLVGQAPLPANLRPFSPSGLLSLEIQLDRRTDTVTNVFCRELSPSAEALLGELLIGEPLESAWEACQSSIEERYLAPGRDALIQALASARRQFRQWRQRGKAAPTGAGPAAETASFPTEEYRPSPNGHSSRKGNKHQLATVLVTLLAHSRLLDGQDGAHRAGRPVGGEVRRQAIQLYAVLHQILHSVQTEEGLLEPQIEPLSVPTLVQRALRRSQSMGRQVPVEQRLPADLPPARGDALVLEEALVLLFDEVSSYALSTGTGVEITAERRRSEMQLTIALRGREEEEVVEGAGEDDVVSQSDPLAQMWEGGLGTLAARTLVEHQGGRLWMQDSFPQGHHILCLALPAHVPSSEEGEKPVPEWRPEHPLPRKTSRVTPAWR